MEVIMTENATKFVSPLTFQTLSQNLVYTDMFKEPKHYDVEHISLAEKADIFFNCTWYSQYNWKIANGIADDF